MLNKYRLIALVFTFYFFIGHSSKSQIIFDKKDSISVDEFIEGIESVKNYRVYINKSWLRFENIPLSKYQFQVEEAVQYLSNEVGLKIIRYDHYNYLVINDAIIKVQNNETSKPINGNQAHTIGSLSQNPSKQNVLITGIIQDGKTGGPVIGSTILIESLNLGTVSNSFGQFELEVPFGYHELEISSIGYVSDVFRINAQSNGAISLELFEELKELEEVTITATAIDENIKGIQSGLNTMTIKGIKNIPSFMGEVDVIKSILLLPGVNNVGEGSSGFNVRGGETSQNLILLDDMMIFNPSHLFGFFSAFQPDVISKIDLYKGGIPSHFGGRLSSVLQVTTRDGNMDRLKGNFSAGIVSSRAAIEGPIRKNKGSFIVAGRGSYVNWLLLKSKNIDLIRSSAGFGDYIVKLNYLLGSRDKLTFSTYESWDNFKLASDTSYHITNSGINLRWDHIFGNSSLLSTSLAQGNTNTDINDQKGFDAFNMNNEIKYKKLKINYNINHFPRHQLDVGLESILYEVSPGTFKPGEQNTVSTEQIISKDKSLESGLYISDQITLNENLSAIAGIRFSNHLKLGPSQYYLYSDNEQKDVNDVYDSVSIQQGQIESAYYAFEPRFSLRYSINNKSSIKVGYNLINQYLHLISNTTTTVPTDFWIASNYHIQPEQANQVSIGYFRNFNDNRVETSIETFYKRLTNAIDFREGGDIILNPKVEADLLSGFGKSYGIEALVKKKAGLLTGWLSYTFSRSFKLFQSENPDYEISNGNFYPSNFDKPHDLSFVGQYSITKRVKLNWNLVFSSGRPVTAPDSKYSQLDVQSIKNYSERNQYRIPDYHRLDVGLVVEKNFKKDVRYKSSWAFSIYNLYARRNAYSIFFNDYGFAYRLSVLGTVFPSITYNLTFE